MALKITPGTTHDRAAGANVQGGPTQNKMGKGQIEEDNVHTNVTPYH